jgi:hypothetical protein
MTSVRGVLRKLAADDRGAIAIPLAILFPLLIGIVGLAVEYGAWQVRKTTLQNVADTAAYSAAIDLVQGMPASTVAQTLERISGLSLSATGYPQLSYATPPATGPYAGQQGYIEVVIVDQATRYLSKLLSPEVVTIRVRSVVQYGGDYVIACALALSDDEDGAIEISGNATAYFNGCSLAVNSVSDRAFYMNGGTVTVEAGCIDSVGGVDYTSNLTLTDCPAPRALQPRTIDPYEGVDIPDPNLIYDCIAGGIFRDTVISAGPNMVAGYPYKCFSSAVTLQGNVAFDPGLYIFKNGDLTMGANSVISGDNVTFLLGASSETSISGTSELHLTATRTGELVGILFVGQRGGTQMTHTFNGNALSEIDGVFYFPKDEFSFSGNSSAGSTCVQYIGNRISVSGNTNLEVGCEPTNSQQILTHVEISLRE